MSPEQCAGQAAGLPQRHLLASGVVLYEWLTGFKLFTGESEVAVLRSITEGKIYAPELLQARTSPSAVEAILMRALEKDRDRRYQSAVGDAARPRPFLAENDFTPSSMHLANFLKQLFSDELEAERARLTPGRRTPCPPMAIRGRVDGRFPPPPRGRRTARRCRRWPSATGSRSRSWRGTSSRDWLKYR